MGGEMKLIKFDLSIDGIKVKDINELRDHFTPEILAHYRSGVLAKWLMTRKYQDELTALASLEDGDDHSLLKALCHVFQIDADERVIAEALREVRPAAVVAMSGQESSRLKFALSINGKRVSRLDDLRANFTIEVLDHYRNGLLSEWLHSHGLTQELAAVNAIDESEDHLLVKSLSRIFAVEADDRLIAEALKTGAQIMPLEPCPGATWTEKLTGIVFVWIPPGCWSAKKKFVSLNSKSNEYIAVRMNGFWLSQQPITNEQRNFLMEENHKPVSDPSSFYENTELSDRQKFIGILNVRNPSKSRFRLPRIAELIYAMSGGANFIGADFDDRDPFVREGSSNFDKELCGHHPWNLYLNFNNQQHAYTEFTMEGELVAFKQGDFFMASEGNGDYSEIFGDVFGDIFGGGRGMKINNLNARGESNLFRIIREACLN